DGDIELDATASVGVIRNKPIEKRSSNYVDETQTITWEVKYNYNEKSIAQDLAYITDTFDDNQALVNGSMQVYVVNIDPDTGEEDGQSLVPSSEYEVTDLPGDDGFKLHFNDGID